MDHKEFLKIRSKLGLTQLQLAEKLGVTSRYVGNLERGVTAIKPTIAMAMCYLSITKKTNKDLSFFAKQAKEIAASWMDFPYCILDTETTGLDDSDEVIEIGVIDEKGVVLLDTLIKPSVSTISVQSTNIHGITYDDTKNAPYFSEVLPSLLEVCRGRRVIIYNSDFDNRLLMQSTSNFEEKEALKNILGNSCLMMLFAQYYGELGKHSSFRWKSLIFAAEYFDVPVIRAHRAIADCQMTLGVLNKLAK